MELEEELEKTKTKTLKYLILTVLIVIPVIFVYSTLTHVNVNIILDLKLTTIILILLLLTLVPPVNSLRMIYIAEKIGVRDRTGGIITRIASQLAASITPSTAAAHIVKSYWIKKRDLGWGRGLGVSLTDSFFDTLVSDLIATMIALEKMIQGDIIFLPIILIALSSLVVYLALFSFAINNKLRDKAVKFVKFIKLPLTEESLDNLGEVFLEIIKKPKNFLITLFLTLVSLLYRALIVVVIALSLGLNMTILDGIVFLSIGQAMRASPIPTGAGLVEFGTTLVASAKVVLTWRIITLSYLTVYYAIFFQIFTVRYLGANKRKI